MKTITLKTISLFMTIFSVAGLGHAGKAYAATSEMSAKKSPFETTTHGGGCGCANCQQPSEETIQNFPA